MSDRSEIEIPPTGLLPEAPAVEREAVDRQPTARELMMTKIIANRERALEAELGHDVELRTTDEPDVVREQHSATRPTNPALGEVEEDRDYQDPYAEPEQPESVAAPAAKPQPKPEVAAPVVQQPAAPPTYPINIDGQQLYVTIEQMQGLAAMGAIANREVQRFQQQQFQPQQRAPEPQPQAPVFERERFAQTVKAIQYGDESTAAQALEDLVNHVASRNPQVDLATINSHAAQAARLEAQKVHFQAKLENDTQLIKTEYADVFANPIRTDAAARQVAYLRQENAALGKYQSELEIYREAGNRVRSAFGLPQSGQSEPPADAGQTAPQAPNIVVRRSAGEIDARKRAAPRAMSQVIDRRSAAPQAPRAPTASDVVEMMRKGRGQTSMR